MQQLNGFSFGLYFETRVFEALSIQINEDISKKTDFASN